MVLISPAVDLFEDFYVRIQAGQSGIFLIDEKHEAVSSAFETYLKRRGSKTTNLLKKLEN